MGEAHQVDRDFAHAAPVAFPGFGAARELARRQGRPALVRTAAPGLKAGHGPVKVRLADPKTAHFLVRQPPDRRDRRRVVRRNHREIEQQAMAECRQEAVPQAGLAQLRVGGGIHVLNGKGNGGQWR